MLQNPSRLTPIAIVEQTVQAAQCGHVSLAVDVGSKGAKGNAENVKVCNMHPLRRKHSWQTRGCPCENRWNAVRNTNQHPNVFSTNGPLCDRLLKDTMCLFTRERDAKVENARKRCFGFKPRGLQCQHRSVVALRRTTCV